MKIAYILHPEVIISNRSNGIRSQAETWASILREENHVVDLVNNWGDYDWKSYDVIHIFGSSGLWLYNVVSRLSKLNDNIAISPIIDPTIKTHTYIKSKFLRFIEKITHGGIKWGPYDFIKSSKYFKKVFVRSQFELDFINMAYGIPKNKFALVQLSYSPSCNPYITKQKENFCLHISSIYQDRKNVIRLIRAAKKYDFKLVLAGNKGSEEQFKKIKCEIGDSKNIDVLGFISEEQKIELYKKAKVFALPSLNEGVGIVAVDAAFYGCEIVITNIPGPKEYYSGKCIEVNPYSIDTIGTAIKSFLDGTTSYQPKLSKYIEGKYSPKSISQLLTNEYKNI